MNEFQPITQYILTGLKMDNLFDIQIERAILLNRNNQDSTKVALYNYDRDFHQKILEVEEKWNTDLKGIFVNMYDFLREYYSNNNKSKIVATENHLIKEDGFSVFKANDDNDTERKSYLYFQEGLLVKKKTFDKNGVLHTVHHYNNKEVIEKVDEYDHFGYLVKSSIKEKKETAYEYFYKHDGGIFLIKQKGKGSNKKIKTVKIRLFDEKSKLVFEFKNERYLWNHFLKVLIDEQKTLLLTDQIKHFHLVQDYDNTHAYKAYFIHNIDKNYNSEEYEIIGMNWEEKTENLSIPDALVFSTEMQKNEVLNYFGKRNNIFHIPILITDEMTHRPARIKRESQSIVTTLSNKNKVELDLLIRAFRMVVDNNPKVTLRIYGLTKIQEDFQMLIDSLDLTDNIMIIMEEEDSEVDMGKVYQNVSGAIFINNFPQINQEMIKSLRNGCPVITYDFSYETKEIISHGENGYIVPKGSVSGLSQFVTKLLTSSDPIQMQEKAVRITERYNELSYLDAWHSLVRQIVSNQPNRNKLTGMKVFLSDCRWTNEKKLWIDCHIDLFGEANNLTMPDIYLVLVNRNTNEKIRIDGSITQQADLGFRYSSYIDLPYLDLSQNHWDLVSILEWENAFYNKRVGHFKNEINIGINIVNNRVITPYFTKAGSNLSFKVGRFITEHEELEKYESEIQA
ncbi:glycosyltransferase [Neobacillus jeddahensis]|uniref:glycosyltransferase n=1 Tax=Neobacillus jeddahensis TaxID=1461580 RepID=UPI0005917861|nr:glycosyltransferase [Neobacillus jeddahensis]